jgi:hypothetical protein
VHAIPSQFAKLGVCAGSHGGASHGCGLAEELWECSHLCQYKAEPRLWNGDDGWRRDWGNVRAAGNNLGHVCLYVSHSSWVIGAPVQGGVHGEGKQLEGFGVPRLEAQRNTVFHLVLFCQLVVGQDQKRACLKGAVKAAQTNCANCANVSWVRVDITKAIRPLSPCNFVADVLRVNNAIQQELAKPMLV